MDFNISNFDRVHDICPPSDFERCVALGEIVLGGPPSFLP
jgi:hypothetical protein